MDTIRPESLGDADRPVFIFGCPRSGTSLLSRIINAHPRIAIPFESHIYHYMYGWRARYGDLSEQRRAECLIKDLLTMEDMKNWRPPASSDAAMAALRRYDFHGVFEALIVSWAAAQGKPRWGEKTPQHALQWREITGAFPGAQVLYIVRDGRDVCVSYKRTFHGPKHEYPIACRWVHYLRIAEEIQEALGNDGCYMVRYEDLIERPDATIQAVCEFLGEDFDPAMLEAPIREIHYRTDQRNQKNLQRVILAKNAGRWKTQMSQRELRIFEGAAGDDLERYGYVRALAPRTLSPLQEAWYTYAEHLPVKAIAVFNNRKTQRILIQMAKIYLRRRWGIWRTAGRPLGSSTG